MHFHGLPYKGLTIKGLVVCYLVWLGSLKDMGRVLGYAQGAWVCSLVVVRMAIKLKYGNTHRNITYSVAALLNEIVTL